MDCESSWITWLLEGAVLLLALWYSLGWYQVRKRVPDSAWHLGAFMGGLIAVVGVWATPLAHLDHRSLTAHMVQHLVLMTVAAPLLLLAKPGVILRHNLPRAFRHSGSLRRRISVQPVLCWFVGTGCVILWHVPAVFELAMRSQSWHAFEQATFLAAGLLFWQPVLSREHSAEKPVRWEIPLYLFLATLPCDALSAFLTFCGRVVYPSYRSGPGLLDGSALRNQEFAGATMWVWVTFVYLVPAVKFTIQELSAREPLPALVRAQHEMRSGVVLNGD